jgi:hypothetical protein
MVEISKSGSGEGSGWVTGPGYSTAQTNDTARSFGSVLFVSSTSR